LVSRDLVSRDLVSRFRASELLVSGFKRLGFKFQDSGFRVDKTGNLKQAKPYET